MLQHQCYLIMEKITQVSKFKCTNILKYLEAGNPST